VTKAPRKVGEPVKPAPKIVRSAEPDDDEDEVIAEPVKRTKKREESVEDEGEADALASVISAWGGTK
jgi:hypothetical protein